MKKCQALLRRGLLGSLLCAIASHAHAHTPQIANGLFDDPNFDELWTYRGQVRIEPTGGHYGAFLTLTSDEDGRQPMTSTSFSVNTCGEEGDPIEVTFWAKKVSGATTDLAVQADAPGVGVTGGQIQDSLTTSWQKFTMTGTLPEDDAKIRVMFSICVTGDDPADVRVGFDSVGFRLVSSTSNVGKGVIFCNHDDTDSLTGGSGGVSARPTEVTLLVGSNLDSKCSGDLEACLALPDSFDVFACANDEQSFEWVLVEVVGDFASSSGDAPQLRVETLANGEMNEGPIPFEIQAFNYGQNTWDTILSCDLPHATDQRFDVRITSSTLMDDYFGTGDEVKVRLAYFEPVTDISIDYVNWIDDD